LNPAGGNTVELLLTTILLLLMVVAAVGVVRMRNLFAVVLLGGVYSFLMATLMVALDAVDVAMTEAAVGAGISVVLLLSVLGLTKTREAPRRHSPAIALIITAAVGAALVYGSVGLPTYGDANAPAHKHVAPEYLARAQIETGAPNIVTAVLASYRGFDTLGETAVIFTGGIGVLVLLINRRRSKTLRPGTSPPEPSDARPPGPVMHDTVILRVAVKVMLPFILLFAAYVQFHGDFGPGGGFQAGVAAATGIIFYGLVFGLRAAQRVAPVGAVLVMIPLGVLLFAGTGVASMVVGGNFLDYSVFAANPQHGQHYGILIVELGVFITVASTMLAIFYAFAGRRQIREQGMNT
jgi:multicomponent Na+:H+ antiporter subunit B